MIPLPRPAWGALLLAGLAGPAFAQPATDLPELVVSGHSPGSPTAPRSPSSGRRWSRRPPPPASSTPRSSPTATPSICATCWRTRPASSCRAATGRSCGFRCAVRHRPRLPPAGPRGAAGRHPGEPGGRLPATSTRSTRWRCACDGLARRQRAGLRQLDPRRGGEFHHPDRLHGRGPNMLRAEGGIYGTWRALGPDLGGVRRLGCAGHRQRGDRWLAAAQPQPVRAVQRQSRLPHLGQRRDALLCRRLYRAAAAAGVAHA